MTQQSMQQMQPRAQRPGLDLTLTSDDREIITDTLNSLIEICYDSFQGYESAAEHAEETTYTDLFASYAKQRKSHIRALTEIVNRYDGEPEDSGQLLATFHRAWMDIKTAVTSGDGAILAECVRGETQALEEYRTAMSKDLPDDVRTVLREQLSEVQLAYNRVHALHAALETS
jgi:uncharacterized protein (TIGR02284 family)